MDKEAERKKAWEAYWKAYKAGEAYWKASEAYVKRMKEIEEA